MKRARNPIASIVTVLAFVSCSGNVPASPTGPSTGPAPIPGSITLSAVTPASGATLNLRDCSHDGWESICTEDLQLALEVVLRRDLPDATVRIAFYDDTSSCVEASLRNLSFAAGVRQTLRSAATAPQMFARYQVSEGGPRETIQPCELPATTNKLSIQIFNTRDVRAPILVKEFDSTYTFAAPRPADQ